MTQSDFIYIIQGTLVSLQYTFLGLGIGIGLGLVLALCHLSQRTWLRACTHAYVSLFRGTPLLVQLSLIYFALPSLLNLKISLFAAGTLAFSLNSAAYICEIIRGGIQSVDPRQFTACQALKIPYVLQMRDIILPQAMRACFPALVNETIALLKETALISVLGEADLMRRAQTVAAASYDYFTPLIVAAGCYYALVLLISLAGKWMERRIQYA